ncbi:hypothetical protein [Pseudomonas lini]
MHKEFKTTQELAMTADRQIVPAQVAGELATKSNKKHFPAICKLSSCVLLLFALQNGNIKAEENNNIENKPPTTEIIIKHWSASFPYGLFSTGPIGCKFENSERICRKDKEPVTYYRYSKISSIGTGSRITNIYQDGPCIIVNYILSVDNSGSEGRTCLSPNAVLKIQLELTTQDGSSTIPH